MKEYLLIFIAFSLLSCGRNYKYDNRICNIGDYSVFVGGNIGIGKEEVVAAVSRVLKQNAGSYFIEIIIFSYSSGKEVFSYPADGHDNMNIKTYSGNISALVKIKQEKSLQKVLFLKADGNGKEEILHRLAEEIGRAVCNN